MSATQELIAAALTAADELDAQWVLESWEPLKQSADDLREACARAMVQQAPDMAEVERLVDEYGAACDPFARNHKYLSARTALLDYVRGVMAERDALIADSERLSGLYEQARRRAAGMLLIRAIAEICKLRQQPVGEAAASVFRMSCPEAQAVLSDPYGLRLLMDYEDQRYSQAESMCGAEEIGQWPTARWTELREKGRQIMSEDLEIWDSDIKAAFGFDKTSQPVGEPEVPSSKCGLTECAGKPMCARCQHQSSEVPMPDADMFDQQAHIFAHSTDQLRTYGDAREAAGYAAGVAAGGELTAAARSVLDERQRQISQEGWTPEHDDGHSTEEMAFAAACYCTADEGDDPAAIWPWDTSWWKPTGRRSNLVKAGALILAEIERMDRLTIRTQPGGYPKWICKTCKNPNLCVSIQGCDREEITR